MADPLTHALDIGSFALWLSAGAAGAIGLLVPGSLPEVVIGKTGSGGGRVEGPVFLMGETQRESSASAPAALAAVAPALPSPPKPPTAAPAMPLPDLPNFPARAPSGGGGPVAQRLAAGETPGPIYPPYSRRMGQAGTAVVRFTIDAAGRVVDASIYSSSGWPLLDREALRTVRSWRYPAGEPLSLVRPIVFRLP